MRVFVTGSTGYIGSAVVAELRRHGHEVTGLVRSREKAAAIEDLGAGTVLGTMDDETIARAAARDHDAVIHTAFDYAAAAGAPEADRVAIDALLTGARATGRPMSVVYTSGVWVLGDTGDRAADESAATATPALVVVWRPAHERLVLDAATDALATAVIRPGLVYGGKGGLVSSFFASAASEGAARYVGDGRNRWALVHRKDLALLYRLVVEKRARGIFHGVDGVPVRVADAARAASEAAGKGGATRSIPVAEARKQMGPVVDALTLDQVVVTTRAGEVGWTPSRTSFLEAAVDAYHEWAK